MRDDKRNYVVVGVFVIGMLAALIAWILLLSGRTGPTDSYYIVYENVMGLKTGVEILYEGYPVGIIDDIAAVDVDGRVRYRVDVSVRRGLRIPVNSVAAIAAPGLLASVVLDIKAGDSREALAPGSEIPGVEAADIFGAMSEVATSAVDLIEHSVKPILGEIADATPNIVGNLDQLSADLKLAVDQINELLGPENVDRVARILANLEATSTDVNRLTAELGDTRRRVDVLIQNMNRLLDEESGPVGVAAEDLNHSLEAIARHIDTITSNLEASSRNLNEFTRQLRENPGVLVRGRDQDSGS